MYNPHEWYVGAPSQAEARAYCAAIVWSANWDASRGANLHWTWQATLTLMSSEVRKTMHKAVSCLGETNTDCQALLRAVQTHVHTHV